MKTINSFKKCLKGTCTDDDRCRVLTFAIIWLLFWVLI